LVTRRLTAFGVAPTAACQAAAPGPTCPAPASNPVGIYLDADGAAWVANARQPSCPRIQAGGQILQESGSASGATPAPSAAPTARPSTS
jgi:hypothetical protein